REQLADRHVHRRAGGPRVVVGGAEAPGGAVDVLAAPRLLESTPERERARGLDADGGQRGPHLLAERGPARHAVLVVAAVAGPGPQPPAVGQPAAPRRLLHVV